MSAAERRRKILREERRRYSDVNALGVLLSAIGALWGCMALKPYSGLFLHVLWQVDAKHVWPIVMIAQSVVLACGSWLNCLTLRRWGFITGTMSWGSLFATATYLLLEGRLEKSIYLGPVCMTTLLLSCACIFGLITEANRQTKGD